MRRTVCALLLLLPGMLTGCSDKRDPNLPDLVPVTGTITLDNKPLANAIVSFSPTGSTRGTASTGTTGADGKYSLSTAHNGAGAPVGDFRVIISKMKLPDGSDYRIDSDVSPMDAGADEALPPQYSDPERSQLKAAVPAGGGTLDFALKSKP